MRLTLLALFVALGSVLMAQSGTLKNTKISVRGTSTMHDWRSEVTKAQGTAKMVKENDQLVSIEDLFISINVEDVKSDKGSIMDKNTYKALNSDKFPKILIKLDKTKSIAKNVSGYKITAVCEVSIAGISRKMTVLANGFDQPNGDIVLTGSKMFKMTDFNVKPPVIFMGALKTSDEVTIEFVTVIPKSAEAM